VTKLEEDAIDLIDESLYYGRIVHNREELIDALLTGGYIWVAASILNLEDSLKINSNTTLIPLSIDGSQIVLKRPFNAGGASSGGSQQVLFIQGKNVRIKPGFKIDGGHPLTSNPETIIVGIYVVSSSTVDVSGLVIEETEICNVSAGIVRGGTIATLPMRNSVIRGNYIHSFCGSLNADGASNYSGITFDWQTRNLHILQNIIAGRVGAESHDVRANGMWIGNLCDNLLIDGNFVDQVDRHPYEIFSSSAAGRGNLDPVIVNNTAGISGTNIAWTGYLGTFGFSIGGCDGTIRVIGNKAGTCTGLAFEFVPDETVGKGKYIVEGNSFDYVHNTVGQACGVSIDSRGAPLTGIDITMRGNVWGKVLSSTAFSLGIQVLFKSKRIFIDGDTFEDSGNLPIYFNSPGPIVMSGITIQNCDFYWSNPALWPANSPSVWFQSTGSTAVLKNNTVHRPPGSGVGIFQATGPNTIKTGGSATADIVTTDPGTVVLVAGESNLFVDVP